MNRFAAILFSFCLLLFASAAHAQVPTSGNIFFGYSFYSTDLSTIDRANTNGWEGSLEGKVFPFLGIVADFDGHYGSQNFPGLCGGEACQINLNATEHNVLFGPRVSASVGRFRPFGEVLVGVGHVSLNNGGGSDTSFASAFGGGLDYKVVKPIALRLQGDYVNTRFFDRTQNNLRLSTGIVFRF